MKLVREEKKKKVFTEDNKIYYVLDMGSYVGHKSRQWYSSKPEIWILMASDEQCKDGETLHIEALVDDCGDYMRFIMQKGDIKRVIQLQHGRVYSDTIDDSYSTYLCMDGDIYSPNQVALDEYLSYEPEFSLNDSIYEGEIPSNDSLGEFLHSNEKLRNALRNTSRR